MKILFLDIDGVLNDYAFLCEADKRGATGWSAETHIDTTKVAELNRVLDATGAKVVLSSSWRRIYGYEKVAEFLKSRGFTGEIIDETPSLSVSGRHREIKRWLESRHVPPERFAIVDDDEGAGVGLESHYVRTKFQPSGGLTARHADKLIQILGATHGFLGDQVEAREMVSDTARTSEPPSESLSRAVPGDQAGFRVVDGLDEISEER